MNKLKFHQLASNLAFFTWVLLGIVTIGSIVNGLIGLYTNIIIGLLFSSIGIYFLVRKSSVKNMVSYSANLQNEDKTREYTIARFLFLENILIIMSTFFGAILLSGAISRAVFERFPIFG